MTHLQMNNQLHNEGVSPSVPVCDSCRRPAALAWFAAAQASLNHFEVSASVVWRKNESCFAERKEET